MIEPPAVASRDLAQRIGEWAVGFEPAAEQLARIRTSIRDFVGCAIAGARRPELSAALRLAHAGPVPVWGLEATFDPASAALVAATAGSLLQLHDVFVPAGLHASSTVIPAAWSALRSRRVAPRPGEFVYAVAAGYEATHRIALACSPGQGAAGSAATGTAGALGASVAAAKLLGADAEGIANAMSNAALFLPATPTAAFRSHGAMAPLHSGMAARAGFEAALIAMEGGSGRGVLEGDAHTPGLIALLRGNIHTIVPEDWRGETLDGIAWKFFPACFASHVALEALQQLPHVEPPAIGRVSISMPRRLLWLIDRGPTEYHLYDRLMSLRWVAARAIEERSYDFRSDLEDKVETRALLERIQIREDPALDALAPDTLGADLEIDSKAGVQRVSYRRPARPPASFSGPLGWTSTNDDAKLRVKFDALACNARADAAEVLGLLDQ